jgi:Subtilase family
MEYRATPPGRSVRLWRTLSPAALLALTMSAAPAAGQALSAQAAAQIRALTEWKQGWTPTERRMDSQLLAALKMERGQPIARGISEIPGVWASVRRDGRGLVRVDIKAEVTEDLLSALRDLGAEIESAFPQYRAIRARVPLLVLMRVADLPGIQYVEPAAEAVTNTGPNTSQGDAAHRAPDVRSLGVIGSGVKLGVLSDGVASLAARQAAGDLPAGVTVLQAGTGDEGTAMLEIIHDLAPGAQLYFATGFGGPAAMAANIVALRNAGCSVIVDDLSYFNEGAFQDGPIAQAVNTVTAAGALYFSSAGNSGNKNDATSGTWEGDFVASGFTLGGAPVHLWNPPSNIYNGLYSSPQTVTLKWSDPLGLSSNDYDFYIYNDTTSSVVAFSNSVQDGNDDPYESIGALPNNLYYLLVVKFSGVVRALKIDSYGGILFTSTAGSTAGHNAAANTVGVAATDARLAGGGPFVGGSTNPVETFSSDGPRRIFYNSNGTEITPGNLLFGTNGGTVLQKPDLTAADCVITGTPGFTTFCGTSAAAPHAAAIAALALSMPGGPSAAQVKAAMAATALDIEVAGVDRDSGAGIVMGNLTVNSLLPPPGFFSVAPCRLVDTRDPTGALGGPALQSGAPRVFALAGPKCGVPATATALSVNVTVAGAAAAGNLLLFPAGISAPVASTISFSAGQTRANNSVVKVGSGATGSITVQNYSAGTVHFILDVNGYFQ